MDEYYAFTTLLRLPLCCRAWCGQFSLLVFASQQFSDRKYRYDDVAPPIGTLQFKESAGVELCMEE